MKKSKMKIIGIVLIFAVEISLYFVAGTYSRYVSTADSNTSTRIAKWSVKLGNVDLAGGEKDFSSELVLETTKPDKVKTGTIAPNTSINGSFTIDPNGTEVAIKYKISLGNIYYKNLKTDEVVTEGVPNIVVSNVTTNVGTLVKNADGTYQGQIDLDGSSETITISAEWLSTSDESDTANGYTPLNVIIPVTVMVEQDI